MAESNLPKGKVEFVQFHEPFLKDGDYTVDISQTVSGAGISGNNTFPTGTKKFRVAGERFSIDPTEITAIFPPEGSRGDHSMVIPHIVLNRSTLPWERYAENDDALTPWMALLVFSEDEAAQIAISQVEFGKLKGRGANAPLFPNLPREQEKNDDKITVIDVPWSILKPQLPSKSDLQFMAHVRQAKDENGNLEGNEMAVLIGNRLPQAGKITTVHLVSLERSFSNGSYFAANAAAGASVRLVSLKSWRFACETHGKSFDALMESLERQKAWFHYPAPDSGIQSLTEMGTVPLPHQLRNGGKTVSVYQGPLAGIDRQVNFDAGPFPARAADDLLLYYENLGIFNPAYAAAWELGRLLTLNSNKIATELFQWKRAHAQQLRQAEQALADPHLPGHQNLPPQAAQLQLPADVEKWFDDLRTLKGLPFNYLVPDESMLPAESLRVFRVDPYWVAALLDGAFSIGRVTADDHGQDDQRIKALNIFTSLFNKPVSGVLIRSEAVAGWPDLLVDGYSQVLTDRNPHPDGKLTLLRMERLSPQILIALFDGVAQTIDVHQKPEMLHFGLNVPDNDHPGYYKELRNTKGREDGREVSTIPWKNGDENSRMIDISTFAAEIHKVLDGDPPPDGTPAFTSAQFALEMIEGVQKVRFAMGSATPVS